MTPLWMFHVERLRKHEIISKVSISEVEYLVIPRKMEFEKCSYKRGSDINWHMVVWRPKEQRAHNSDDT